MFGITDKPAAPTTAVPADLIKDGTEAGFMQDVIEPSQTVPVIVDFWAPWCGPCKTLGPALEAAVIAAKGRVRMVKINVDQNQALAAQLRIQSIPTVYAFFQGQPVDGFQGAVAPSEIKRFVDHMAGLGPDPDNGLADAIAAAETMLTDGEYDDAIETFTAILEEEPENAQAYAGLIRCQIAVGDLDQAQAMANAAPAKIATSKEVEAVRADLETFRAATEAKLGEFAARLDSTPAPAPSRSPATGTAAAVMTDC